MAMISSWPQSSTSPYKFPVQLFHISFLVNVIFSKSHLNTKNLTLFSSYSFLALPVFVEAFSYFHYRTCILYGCNTHHIIQCSTLSYAFCSSLKDVNKSFLPPGISPRCFLTRKSGSTHFLYHFKNLFVRHTADLHCKPILRYL